MATGSLLMDLSPLRSSRDFRYVFTARLVSLLGLGLVTVAIPVQVFELTRSSLQVAGVGAVLGATMLVALLGGGVLADRTDRRLLVVWTRALSVLVFAVLAGNALLPTPQVWVIYLCAVANGATALGQPAMMAMTPAIVDREQLAAAGALLALSAQVGAVVGPALGGVLLAVAGGAANYGLNAVAAVASTILVLRLSRRPQELRSAGPSTGTWRSLAEGAIFMWRDRVVRGVLLIDVAAMVFAMPRVLFPQITDEVFGGGPTVAGLLYSVSAAGAMLAALVSGWVTRVRRTGLLLIASVLVYGATTAGVGVVALPLALVLLAVAGAADTVSEILRRALLAAATPDHLQGRVSGVWLAQAMVGPAVGGVEAGVAARLVRPGPAIALGGAVCVAATTALAAFSPPLRRAQIVPSESSPGPATSSTTLTEESTS